MRLLTRTCAPLLTGVFLGSMAHAGTVAGLDTPEGRLAAYRKIQCSLIDGKETVYWWKGAAWGNVAGQPDIRLFRVEGVNVRQCATVRDPDRGAGFRLLSREILVYQDPETGEMLDRWENPYTGATVEVIHVQNDPVNQPAVFPRWPDGADYQLPLTTQGDDWWWSVTAPLFYPNPLAGKFQKYVGGTYHATEMFNFKGRLSDLLDAESDSAGAFVGWVRLAQWLPWMEMGSRSGKMYFHAGGVKLGDYADLPGSLRATIEAHFPLYRHAPPLDDDRPNETSWTYFRKVIESRRAQQ